MPSILEPFAHNAARLDAQRRAVRHAVGFALVAGGCVAGAPVATLLVPALALPVVAACGVVLVVHAAWTLSRVRRLYRVVVGAHVSAAGLAVCDAGGRERVIRWNDVEHVDLCDGGVEVVVRQPRIRLRFGADWPHADRLARVLVRHADAHGRPLCVDGIACGALSLAALRPALSPAPDADAA